jgi:hypothetical protein
MMFFGLDILNIYVIFVASSLSRKDVCLQGTEAEEEKHFAV